MSRKLFLVLSLITVLAIPFITQAAEPQTQSENLTLGEVSGTGLSK